MSKTKAKKNANPYLTPTGRPTKAFLDSIDPTCIYFFRDPIYYEEFNTRASGLDRFCSCPSIVDKIKEQTGDEEALFMPSYKDCEKCKHYEPPEDEIKNV